eukprot:TRINITY_DN4886_c0_g1_i1.p1 TRINITY_DN4886_c0_g1~~TRINITY_DN4886_c0_g1_i1.p1  ORF type:complete len:1104 (-),score=311.66 TRINITY_DN4886_c0_g1_i1:78-3389(-)
MDDLPEVEPLPSGILLKRSFSDDLPTTEPLPSPIVKAVLAKQTHEADNYNKNNNEANHSSLTTSLSSQELEDTSKYQESLLQEGLELFGKEFVQAIPIAHRESPVMKRIIHAVLCEVLELSEEKYSDILQFYSTIAAYEDTKSKGDIEMTTLSKSLTEAELSPGTTPPLSLTSQKSGASSWSGTASWLFGRSSKPTTNNNNTNNQLNTTIIDTTKSTPIVINIPAEKPSAASSMTSSLTAFFKGTTSLRLSPTITPTPSPPPPSSTTTTTTVTSTPSPTLVESQDSPTLPLVYSATTASDIDVSSTLDSVKTTHSTSSSSAVVPHSYSRQPEKKFGWRVKKLFTTLKTERGKDIKPNDDQAPFDVRKELPNFQLKLRSRPDLLSQIDAFTTEFDALGESDINEKAELYRGFSSEFTETWCDIWQADDDTLVADLLELHLMQMIYPLAYPSQEIEGEAHFNESIEKLRNATPAQLGVKLEVFQKVPWQIIAEELHQVEAEITTYLKLISLVKCVKLLADGVKQSMGGENQGADDLIPALTYVIIQSCLFNSKKKFRLKANLEFIRLYKGESQLLGALGYCYISICIAVAYLEDNPDKILKQTPQAVVKTLSKQPAGSFGSVLEVEKKYRKQYISEEKLSAILLKIVLDNLRDELYDARVRYALKIATRAVGYDEDFLCTHGEALAEAVINPGASTIQASSNASSSNRIFKVVALTVAGTVLIGATGGLLTPVVGGALAGMGLSSAVATVIAATGLKGAALVSIVFGVTGGAITAEKARRQTAGITDFVLEKTDSTGMHVTVGIMGWLEQKHGNKAHWEDVLLNGGLTHPGSLYILMWETEACLKLGISLKEFMERIEQVTHSFNGKPAKSIYEATLKVLTIYTAPLLTEWNNIMNQSKKVGYVLAQELVSGCFGARPITLIGASAGARVVYYCLKKLWVMNQQSQADSTTKEKRDIFSLVENVILIGCPISAPTENKSFMSNESGKSMSSWITFRSLVAGRFVNCYNPTDMLFDCLFGSSSPLAGTSPIHLPPELSDKPIENLDISDIAPLHIDYNKKDVIQTILARVKIHSTERCDLQEHSTITVTTTSSHTSSDDDNDVSSV